MIAGRGANDSPKLATIVNASRTVPLVEYAPSRRVTIRLAHCEQLEPLQLPCRTERLASALRLTLDVDAAIAFLVVDRISRRRLS
jgi:hypothetical protein